MYCKYECRGDRGRLLIKLQKRLLSVVPQIILHELRGKEPPTGPQPLDVMHWKPIYSIISNEALWTSDVYNLLKWILLINRGLLKGCGKHFPDYIDKEQHCLMALEDGNKWRHLVVWRSHCYRHLQKKLTMPLWSHYLFVIVRLPSLYITIFWTAYSLKWRWRAAKNY